MNSAKSEMLERGSFSLSFSSLVTHVSIFVLEKNAPFANYDFEKQNYLNLILCSSRLSAHRVMADHWLEKKRKKDYGSNLLSTQFLTN